MFFVTGDIHGDSYDFIDRMGSIEHKLTEDDSILCLGDVGLKYGYSYSDSLREAMKSFPCKFIIMRGNHDTRYCRDFKNRSYGPASEWRVAGDMRTTCTKKWNGIDITYDTGYRNIYYLPDEGGVFTVNGKHCLVIPGAYSIDKDFRLAYRHPYEVEEQLTYSEMDSLLELAETNGISYVFSHTAPYSWKDTMSDLYISDLAEELIDNTMERFCDEVLEKTSNTLERWYFGHFHDDRDVKGTKGTLVYRDVKRIDALC